MYDAAQDLLRGGACLGCRRGGRLVCGECLAALQRRPHLAWPTPGPPGLVPPYAAGEYAGLLRALVLGHKEHALLPLAQPLGLLLARSVAAALVDAVPAAEQLPEAAGPVVLVPVPSRRAVVRARGHEPTWEVTSAAAGHLRALGWAASAQRLLSARGVVLDQSGLGARARAANLAGTMRCPSQALLRLRRRHGGAHTVVCDDVLTTGATLREAQRALEASGLRPAAAAVVAATRRRTTPSLVSDGLTD